MKIPRLSTQQKRILQLIEEGDDTELIAEELGISTWTVRDHVRHMAGIFGVRLHDCRWWNLAALCQRCHLTIQAKVYMEREHPFPHTPWFRPHAAGWYAVKYLGADLSREETAGRLDELLALEQTHEPLF